MTKPEDKNLLLTPEEIRLLNEQWEVEYEDVEMTDAEWELKRWSLIAETQLAKVRKHQVQGKPDREKVAKICYQHHPSWEHTGLDGELEKVKWEKLDVIIKQTFYSEADQLIALQGEQSRTLIPDEVSQDRPKLMGPLQRLWCQHCKVLQKTNNVVVECWYNPLDEEKKDAFCAANCDAIDYILALIPDEKEKAECDHIFGRIGLYERYCVECGLEQVRDVGTEPVWRDKALKSKEE